MANESGGLNKTGNPPQKVIKQQKFRGLSVDRQKAAFNYTPTHNKRTISNQLLIVQLK